MIDPHRSGYFLTGVFFRDDQAGILFSEIDGAVFLFQK